MYISVSHAVDVHFVSFIIIFFYFSAFLLFFFFFPFSFFCLFVLQWCRSRVCSWSFALFCFFVFCVSVSPLSLNPEYECMNEYNRLFPVFNPPRVL